MKKVLSIEVFVNTLKCSNLTFLISKSGKIFRKEIVYRSIIFHNPIPAVKSIFKIFAIGYCIRRVAIYQFNQFKLIVRLLDTLFIAKDMAYIKEILHELIVNDVILITIWKESICPFYIKFMIYRSCLIRVFFVQIFILCLEMFECSQFFSSRVHLNIQLIRKSIF